MHRRFETPEIRQEYQDDLEFVKEMFDKAGIQFFLMAGTYLGAMREHDFIAWDDDIDLGIFWKDVDKLLEIIPEFRKNDFFVGWGPRRPTKPFWIKLYRKIPIDVLVFFKHNGKWKYYHGQDHREYCFWQNNARYFDKLDEVEFRGKKYFVPSSYEEVLFLWYDRWKEKAGGNCFAYNSPLVPTNFETFKQIINSLDGCLIDDNTVQ